MLFSNRSTRMMAFLLFAASLGACSKDDDPANVEPVDRARSAYIIEDNINFTICKQVLGFTGQFNLLKSDTSLTFLAPDNEAFMLQQIHMAPHYAFADEWFHNVARNMILPGIHHLRLMPLGDNQPLHTITGNNVYVSRYMSGSDTITRVNGVKVASIDIMAGNGLLQSMTEVVQPERKNNLADMLLSDTSFTLFTQALQHSGLLGTLREGEYTILAPHNDVLRSSGTILPGIDLSTSVNILEADPAALSALMKYHILPGRYFLDGIHRAANASGNASLITLNGEAIIVGGDLDSYLSTSFLGHQNASPAGVYRFWSQQNNMANLPAGNGVVHTINKVLIP